MPLGYQRCGTDSGAFRKHLRCRAKDCSKDSTGWSRASKEQKGNNAGTKTRIELIRGRVRESEDLVGASIRQWSRPAEGVTSYIMQTQTMVRISAFARADFF
mmetsp:Transcript_29583/g.67581  ORF Transcript_29583/g.67581 Transcript_29583/m.67581 type:complete len:102 (+) Transcript_29583:444-749(+)